MFGNTELASHVIVYDALPKSQQPLIGFRTRVAIDRMRRAARSGVLFRYEYVEPGREWGFKLKAYNLELGGESWAALLFRSLLDYVKEFGIEVGSMRSIGLGLLELKEARATVYEVKNLRLVKVNEEVLAG